MKHTIEFRVHLTKWRRMSLRWEHRLQSAHPGPEVFTRWWASFERLWTASVESAPPLGATCEIADDTVGHHGRNEELRRMDLQVSRAWALK